MRNFLLDALDLGMMDGTYAYFTTEVTLNGRIDTTEPSDGRDDEAKQAFEGNNPVNKFLSLLRLTGVVIPARQTPPPILGSERRSVSGTSGSFSRQFNKSAV